VQPHQEQIYRAIQNFAFEPYLIMEEPHFVDNGLDIYKLQRDAFEQRARSTDAYNRNEEIRARESNQEAERQQAAKIYAATKGRLETNSGNRMTVAEAEQKRKTFKDIASLSWKPLTEGGVSPQEQYFKDNKAMLDKLGIYPMYDEQGNYIPTSRQSDVTADKNADTASTKAAQNPLSYNLKNLYLSLSNPRLTLKGRAGFIKQIQETEKKLGIPSGSIDETMLADMSPADRERFNQGRKRAEEGIRHNKEMEKQGRERIEQSRTRIQQAQERIKSIGSEKDPSVRLFKLQKSAVTLKAERDKLLTPDLKAQLIEEADETGYTTQQRRTEIKAYTDMVVMTRAEIERLKGRNKKTTSGSSTSGSSGQTKSKPGRLTREQIDKMTPEQKAARLSAIVANSGGR
jgi:hypothetical protein